MKIGLDLLRRRPASSEEERAAMDARPTPHQRAKGVSVSDGVRTVYQVASLCLAYPTQELVDQVPTLRRALDEARHAGARSAGEMGAFLDHLEGTPLVELQDAYVQTFDLRRRCCLFLTYYGYGDTRRRGMALLDLKLAYRASGVELSDDELPDHLCVLLEFTATVDPPVGRVLLTDLRPGIELLRLSLEDRRSPYVHVVQAITGTFPTLEGDTKDVVARLIASGPPDEEVGAESYLYVPGALR